MKKKNIFFNVIAYILTLLFVLSLLGYFIFLHYIVHLTQPKGSLKADAIVVLTGGRSRIGAATNLLQKESGNRLLISGVSNSFHSIQIKNTAINRSLFSKIDLGYQAKNTFGNAAESSDWIKKYKFKSIILVTNNYHLPRSLLEFKRILPNVKITGYPVAGNYILYKEKYSPKIDLIWFKITVIEYVKYLKTYLFR